MKTWFKLVLFILAFVLGTITISFGTEIVNYQREAKTLEVFIELSAKSALKQQQDLYQQWNSTGSASAGTAAALRYSMITPEAAAEIQVAIGKGLIGPNTVIDYCDGMAQTLQQIGFQDYDPLNGAPGPNDTEMYYNLEFMRDTSQLADLNYNPMQYGLTFVDEELLSILFRDNFKRMISANYLDAANVGQDQTNNNVNFREARAVISGFYLKNMEGTEKENKNNFEQLFGVPQGDFDMGDLDYENMDESGHQQLLQDAFSNWIVVYEVRFIASGWHNMRTTLVSRQPEGSNFGITGDNSNIRWWTADIGNGETQQFLSFGLPQQKYDTTYILTN